MARSLNLDKIVDLADSGAYGGGRVLSASSAALALCSGVFLSELRNWQGAGYSLSEGEIDTIKDMVALLEYELQTEASMTTPAMVKIAEEVRLINCESVVMADISTDIYKQYKLVIQETQSDHSTGHIDGLVLRVNDSEVNADYTSFNVWEAPSATFKQTNEGDYPGVIIWGGCAGDSGNERGRGSAEIIIDGPKAFEWKRLRWISANTSPDADELAVFSGCGMYGRNFSITRLEIFPQLGDEFIISSTEPTRANHLVMTLFGVP